MITSKLANAQKLFTAFILGAALALVFCLLLLGHISFLDSLSYEAATLGSFFIPLVIFAMLCHLNLRAARKHSATAIMNSVYLPMFLLDAESRCLISNLQAQQLLTHAPSDLAGKLFSATCIPEDEQASFDQFLAKANLNTVMTGEFTLLKSNGARMEVELTAKKTAVGRLNDVATLVIVQNSRLKAQVQAELTQTHLELNQYLESASSAMVAVDVNRKVTLWNQAAETLIRLPKSAVLGRNLPLSTNFPDHIAVLAAIDQALKGIETTNFEISFTLTHRQKLELLINITTRRRYNGIVSGALIQVTNITRLREKAKMSSESEKLLALGTLTGGVAHDFNNLLTVIMGNLTLLTEDKQTLTEFEFDEIANDALSAANDGARLTQQLLLFARRQRLEPVLTNINELVYNLVRRITRNLGEQVTLKVTPHESSPFGLVDPAMLESAITNLCFNARDALDAHGQIEIVVGLRTINTSEMSLATDSATGDYVSISVIDNGAGIPAAALKHIFEPFWTTKPLGKGSGMGLSMVQGFAAQSSGFVTIDNAVDEPTKVTLNLPKYSAPVPSGGISAPLINKKQPSQVNFKLAKILVVEDEAIVRAYAVRCLKSLGHRTVQAANAAEAIDILQQDPQISVVFSDIRMPGALSGRDLQQLITERYPHIKILLTTGYEDLAKIAAGKADQAFNDKITILKKPYTRASLTETLASLT